MKTKITKYVIAGLIVVLGFVSWMTVDWAINIPTFSTWLVPSIWFILFFIALTLGAILIRKKILLFSVLAVGLFSSLYFAFSFWHALILILCFFLALTGLERISSDLSRNIKFSITKSVRTGKTLIILALSIAITSQYYAQVKNTDKIKIIPKLEIGETVNQILPMIYPDLKDSTEDDLTVDEFISEMSKQNADVILQDTLQNSGMDLKSTGMSEEQMAQIVSSNQDKILKEQRKSFSSIAGVPLTGEEKISGVFSEMINDRINRFFSPSLQKNSQPFLPWIASFFLFLTVASLGSFFGSLAGYLVALIFLIMRKNGLVKVSKKMVEMEVIE
jgi:hypothetical protein